MKVANRTAFPLSVAASMKTAVVLLLLAVFLAGCSSIYIDRRPRTDFSKIKRVYVERRLSDNHQIDQTIVAELRALGLEASSGPLTMLPDGTDAIVTYQDEWAWDFKSYLIEFNLQLRGAIKEQYLAAGTYRQPSPITKSPAEIVHLILARIFKQP
jgi:hypothetical protein